MKILYVTTVGSTMGFFDKLISDLVTAGNTVDIATNEHASKVPDCFRDLGCRVYQISTSRSPFRLGNLKAVKQIKKLAVNYDVVHCHTPLAAAATRLACRNLRRTRGLKVFYTAHGFHFYKGASLLNWLIYYPIEKLCSRWTDVLITINKEDYEIAKQKMHAKQTEYVHGVGFDSKKFAEAKIDENKKRKEIGLPPEAYALLSVGELNRNKNHQIVVKAIAELHDSSIHYVIAGVGPEKKRLEKLAQQLGVNLHLLGYRRDIMELCKASDAFVFPSIREGLGLAPLEALASGLPLICSDNRGTREYSKYCAQVCASNSPTDFAKAISRVKNRSVPLPSFSSYVALFDYENINRTMKSLYQSVLNHD